MDQILIRTCIYNRLRLVNFPSVPEFPSFEFAPSLLLLYPRSPFDLVLYFGWWLRKSFRAQTRAAVGAWIGEQFLLGLISRGLGAVGGVAFWAHVGGFASGLLCAALALPKATAEEREAILRPKALTEEEKDELFADRAEKPSELTTLNLNR
jgi:hypothetical protein